MSLHCLHLCTSDAWGGLEAYACTLMVELQRAGCRVSALCRPGSKVEAFLIAHGIRSLHLPRYSVPSLKSIQMVKELVEQEQVKVVHVHFHSDIWHASLALQSDASRKLFLGIYMGVPKKNDLLHRFIYKRVDGIFTSSKDLYKRLPALYPVPESKIHLLPYGRNIDRYICDPEKRNTIRKRYKISAQALVVGTMVRIDPGKGVMDFARSISYIPEALRSKIVYLIVGEPTRKGRVKSGESPFEPHCESYLEEMKRFIAAEDLSSQVVLAGYQEDLIGYLSAMDCFVFPSRDELYSLVVLDAMAMGLPIVAARAGGNIDQIEDTRTGFLYTVADSKDLAGKIIQYAESSALRAEHGRAARRFVEAQHSMKDTIDRLLEYYNMSENTERR